MRLTLKMAAASPSVISGSVTFTVIFTFPVPMGPRAFIGALIIPRLSAIGPDHAT